MSFLLSLLLGPIQPVHAAGYTIKQILGSRNRVVVENSGGLDVGTELIATFKNGTQCTLKVTAVDGRVANADTTYCDNASYLVVGQSLEKSLYVEEDRAPVRPSKQSGGSPTVKTQPTWVPRPPPARSVVDLQYWPRMGEFVFMPGLAFDQKNSTTKDSPTKDKIDSTTVESNILRAQFLYGYTQDVTLGLSLGYLVNQTAEVNFGAGSPNNGQKDTAKADGLYDPTFKFGYRWIEQDSMPAIIDIFASFSPGIGKNKTATTTARGSAYRGGNLFSLGAEVGNKSPTFSFVFGLDLDFYGPSTAIAADTGVGTRYSPVNAYTLRASGQLPVSQALHVRGTLARVSTGEVSSAGDVRLESTPQTVISAALVQEWSATMALQLNLSKGLEAESNRKVGSATTADITSDSLVIGATALMVF